MVQYPDHFALLLPLIRTAREELLHFEQVMALIQKPRLIRKRDEKDPLPHLSLLSTLQFLRNYSAGQPGADGARLDELLQALGKPARSLRFTAAVIPKLDRLRDDLGTYQRSVQHCQSERRKTFPNFAYFPHIYYKTNIVFFDMNRKFRKFFGKIN